MRHKLLISSNYSDITFTEHPDGYLYAKYKLGTINKSNAGKFTVVLGVGLNSDEVLNANSLQDAIDKIDAFSSKKQKMAEGGNTSLRSIRVTFDDGSVIETDMAAHLTDQDMLDYYRVGKYFNVGSFGKDKMAKVVQAEITDGKTIMAKGGYVEGLDLKKIPLNYHDRNMVFDISMERNEVAETLAEQEAKKFNKRITKNLIESIYSSPYAFWSVRDLIEKLPTTNFQEVLNTFRKLYPLASSEFKSALETGLKFKAQSKVDNIVGNPYIYDDPDASAIRDLPLNQIESYVFSSEKMAKGGGVDIENSFLKAIEGRANPSYRLIAEADKEGKQVGITAWYSLDVLEEIKKEIEDSGLKILNAQKKNSFGEISNVKLDELFGRKAENTIDYKIGLNVEFVNASGKKSEGKIVKKMNDEVYKIKTETGTSLVQEENILRVK